MQNTIYSNFDPVSGQIKSCYSSYKLLIDRLNTLQTKKMKTHCE